MFYYFDIFFGWCGPWGGFSHTLTNYFSALVFPNRMFVGGAGRVVCEMGHTLAQMCPGNKYFPPYFEETLRADMLFLLGHFGTLLIYFGTSQHPSSPSMLTPLLLVYKLLYLINIFVNSFFVVSLLQAGACKVSLAVAGTVAFVSQIPFKSCDCY